jgi:uncharacterized protein YlxW (UPF0749 family)
VFARHRKNLLWTLSVFTAGLTLSLLLSVAWRGSTALGPAGSELGANGAGVTTLEASRIWATIERLEAEQLRLKADLALSRRELAERQETVAAATDRLHALQQEVARQRFLAGLTPAQGPGLVVLLDDSEAPIPPRADPDLYLIHEYDLRDVVNLLWMAGAEAVAVNDERLVSNWSITCVGSTVMVNSTRLSPPYRIQALGHPRLLEDVLRNPSYLTGLRERQQQVGIRFEVEGAAKLILPAYDGSLVTEYVRPGE